MTEVPNIWILKATLLWYSVWLKAWCSVAHLRTCSFSLVTTVVPSWEYKSIIPSRLIVQTLSCPVQSQKPPPCKHRYKENSLRHKGMVSDKHKHRMFEPAEYWDLTHWRLSFWLKFVPLQRLKKKKKPTKPHTPSLGEWEGVVIINSQELEQYFSCTHVKSHQLFCLI